MGILHFTIPHQCWELSCDTDIFPLDWWKPRVSCQREAHSDLGKLLEIHLPQGSHFANAISFTTQSCLPIIMLPWIGWPLLVLDPLYFSSSTHCLSSPSLSFITVIKVAQSFRLGKCIHAYSLNFNHKVIDTFLNPRVSLVNSLIPLSTFFLLWKTIGFAVSRDHCLMHICIYGSSGDKAKHSRYLMNKSL